MRVAFIGLGKLGLPVAVSFACYHEVVGYDVNPALCRYRVYDSIESGPEGDDQFQTYFEEVCRKGRGCNGLTFASSICEAVQDSELIFVAVQTPHGPEHEGITRISSQRADFEYKYLEQAVCEICSHVKSNQTIVVISTVLPGTMAKRILPITRGKAELVYNPFFAAMGTVMRDVMNPEFVLLGGSDEAVNKAHYFYGMLYQNGMPPVERMSIESAELTKVAYNTFLTQKIVFANTLMEICHGIPGCNVDEVTGALKKATDRVISPKYMDAGVGDGGNCHPRDNIAMSWLAKELNLSNDLFLDIMIARERQMEWIAKQVAQNYHGVLRLNPVVVLGKAYKPKTNLTGGSPAILLGNLLDELCISYSSYDPCVDGGYPSRYLDRPSLYVIATKHAVFSEYGFPQGSTVIDPFRYIPERSGVKVIPLGIGK